MIVDKLKPRYVNSNDGNTARCFFENSDESNSITGIIIRIIKRFKTILKSMTSGYSINLEIFKDYAG